ncbi:hypothetical protein LDENG_00121980 [Lucifuga dentata]|nr:hypothetical protein LDENG_00121980 [Lucifuga dentata]
MIKCSQTIGAQYFWMLWYQQLPGQGMRQILYAAEMTKISYEPGFTEEKFSVTKPDVYSGTLTVKTLEAEDEGLYFCAVSEHGDADQLNN